MEKPDRKKLGPAGWLLTALYVALAAYVYAGFFSPHPTIIKSNAAGQAVMAAIRIAFPVLALGLLAIFIGSRLGWVKKGSGILLLLTLLLIGIVLYPAADFFYRKRFQIGSSAYHSFLQMVPPVPSGVDPSKFNVFCLGGSTTQFRDKAGRDWPGMVEKTLRERYGLPDGKVYNLGKFWYTTQHLLTNYIQNLRKYRPAMLIIMENINDALHNADFSRFSNGPFREDYGHFLGPEAYMIKSPTLFSFLYQTLGLLWYADDVLEVQTTEFPGLVSYERNIRTMVELAGADGTQVVLMTQPNLYSDHPTEQELAAMYQLNQEATGNKKRWSYRTAKSALDQYNDKIREIAKAQDLMLIDLERQVPKSLEYFIDDVHYQDRAMDLIAGHLSEVLAPLMAGTRRPGP